MTRQLVADRSAGPIRSLADSDLAANPAVYRAGRGGWGFQWFGSGGAGTTSYVAGAGPNGYGVARKVWTTPSSSNVPLDLGASFSFVAQTFKAGQTYTFSMGCMSSWATGQALQLSWRDGNGNAIGATVLLGTGASDTTARAAAAAGQRVRLRATAVAPAGVSHATLIIGPYATAVSGAAQTAPVPGDVFEAFMPMAVEGVYTGDFSCSYTPGWVALPDGTSAGYPYTLGRVLGGFKPLGAIDPTPPTNFGNSKTGLGLFDPRTVFWVYDSTNWTANTQNAIGRIGGLAQYQNRIRLLQGNGTDGAKTSLSIAIATSSTTEGASTIALPGGASAGRHIVHARIDTVNHNVIGSFDGSAYISGNTPTTDIGWAFDDLYMYAGNYSQGSWSGVYAMVIPSIDETIVRAVERWLANHYGVPLAAG